MKIRVEVSSLASSKMSGVANYTKMLVESLNGDRNIETHASYFNFLNRQPIPNLSIKKSLEKNSIIPLRIYAKLQSYSFAPPFDVNLSKVDLTIFPNFATWPSMKSRLRATVIHDLTYIRFPDTVDEKNLVHLKRVVPRSIKEADFIITISEAVKSELMKEFDLPPDKCVITTIPPDDKYHHKNDNEIHDKYGIPTKKFIYFIGNLEPRKDLPTLIKAYCKLPTAMKKEYSLIMAGGNGWKTENSRKAIKNAQKNSENVAHIGFVDDDDAAAFYQKATMFVMPSIYEGFGMPILESMASGCPVIASDIPVLKEVGGDAALYAKAGDSDDFKEVIEKLIKDTGLQKKLVQLGKQNLKNFSLEKNAKIISDKVKSLI
ncbi:MAG: glycosyltransferase family 1 protein [Candidatus Saccharibacteria bacterium]